MIAILHEHPRMLDYDYQELINFCILCKTTLVSSGKSSTFCDDKRLVFVFVHIIESDREQSHAQ